MAAAESTYLKVVADKSHDFRTGTITAAARDAAVATAWTSCQNTAIQQRNTYRVNQAGAAATYRNAAAGRLETCMVPCFLVPCFLFPVSRRLRK